MKEWFLRSTSAEDPVRATTDPPEPSEPVESTARAGTGEVPDNNERGLGGIDPPVSAPSLAASLSTGRPKALRQARMSTMQPRTHSAKRPRAGSASTATHWIGGMDMSPADTHGKGRIVNQRSTLKQHLRRNKKMDTILSNDSLIDKIFAAAPQSVGMVIVPQKEESRTCHGPFSTRACSAARLAVDARRRRASTASKRATARSCHSSAANVLADLPTSSSVSTSPPHLLHYRRVVKFYPK
jgi:hypothetical protein